MFAQPSTSMVNPDPTPAPTPKEWEQAAAYWTGRGVPAPLFAPLQAAFTGYLSSLEILAAEGVLASIHPQAFTGADALSCITSYLEHLPFFFEMEIPLHRWLGAQASHQIYHFYQIAGSFLNVGFVGELILCCLTLREVPQSAPHTGHLLASAIMNVSQNLLLDEPENKPHLQPLVVNRMQRMSAFVLSLGDLPPLAGYHWKPTGSDPHCNGCQAVYLLSQEAGFDPGYQAVLKPHPMEAEDAVLCPHGGLADFANRHLLEPHGLSPFALPTLPTHCVRGRLPQGGYFGIQHFAQKQAQMDPQQTSRYFVQMGMLALLCKLWGMTDLHQDNVMPTQTGPVPVDGECALDRQVIRSRNLGKTGLQDAILQKPNAFCEPSVAHFAFDRQAYPQQQLQRDVSLGFRWMQDSVRQPQLADALGRLFLQKLETRPTIRLLIENTRELAAMLSSFAAVPSSRAAILDILMDRIHSSGYAIRLEETAARAALEQAFTQGDIPLFQLQITPGHLSPLLINGQEVGRCSDYLEPAAVLQDFQENLRWLLTLQQADVLRFLGCQEV